MIVQRAGHFVAGGPAPAAFRIGFARARPEELRLAVKRLRAALDEVMVRRSPIGARAAR